MFVLRQQNWLKYYGGTISEGLRKEEFANNIRSTIISPGTVDTELHTTINDPKNREWEI